jgi:hypothetical protein
MPSPLTVWTVGLARFGPDLIAVCAVVRVRVRVRVRFR